MIKTGRALLSFLLAAVMAFSLGIAGRVAAFAEDGNPAEAAQEYEFVCTRMSVEYLRYATGYTGGVQPVKDHYVAAEYDSYYVKLNVDGTGYPHDRTVLSADGAHSRLAQRHLLCADYGILLRDRQFPFSAQDPQSEAF